MSINVIFNDFSYEILPKQQETFDKYCKILQWGRQNPTRFLEDFLNLSFTDHQKWIILSSWTPSNIVWLCSRSSGKSFMSAPFMIAKTLLFPSFKCYIMAPSGSQSMETFSKLENLAKNNISSVIGVTPVFLDECIRPNSATDPFTHNKSGYSVELYNGSEIHSLNSVATNIVGIRSNLNVYDEAGKIPRDFYALTLPFTVQNTDFVTGGGINTEIFPKQIQNQNLLLSSAEGIDSELYDRYKRAFEKMLVGDPEYFVCDINCQLSLHPFINGVAVKPLVQQSTIDDAFNTNPYRAEREYYNRFDSDGGEDVLVKRSVINKFSKPFYPVFENDGTRTYICAYDPATKIDNAVIGWAELIRDEDKGLMLKIINVKNLIEVLKNGEKMVIQRPQQIEILKDMIVDYNRGKGADYDGIDMIIIDAGAGGGGNEVGQFLMNEWMGKDKKTHLGLIDPLDDYMKLRLDDYPQNVKKLSLFNFKRNKTQGYDRTQQAINQGLVIFPASLNARGELEIEETDSEGNITIRYEKPTLSEANALIQVDLCKEELVGMQKQKKPNGTVVYDLSPEAKQRNMHDDHADVIMMLCDRLMELRANEALTGVKWDNSDDMERLRKEMSARYKRRGPASPFESNKKANPFLHKGQNPFKT